MIWIDPRVGTTKKESRSERLEKLLRSFEEIKLEAKAKTLDFGDVMFEGPHGKAAIELKTVKDLVNNITSGHLADHQIPGLLKTYGPGRCWILIEGIYRFGRGSGIIEVPAGKEWRQMWIGKRPIFWNAIEGALTTFEAAGVPHRHTSSPFGTVLMVKRLHDWWEKTEHTALQSIERPGPNTGVLKEDDPWTKRMRITAMGISGGLVGWKRSKAAAESFDTITDMVLAGEARWQAVEGYGKGLAKAIVTNVNQSKPTRRS